MKIEIEGMSCQACVRRVKRALDEVPGITVERVEVGSAELQAPADQTQVVLDAVKNAGYNAKVAA